MEKDNIQKELFGEFEAPKKRPKNMFGQFFQKTDFAVSLSPEKLVFVSIGIIMLLVVFFALGVEKGKTIAASNEQASALPTQPQAQRPAPVAPIRQTAQIKTTNTATNIAPKDKAAAVDKSASVSAQSLPDKSKPYTIVAATFSKEAFATQEVTRLKAGGLEAFVIKSDPYYLACVGAFANKDGAKTMLNKIRQMHKDAYVRLR